MKSNLPTIGRDVKWPYHAARPRETGEVVRPLDNLTTLG